MSVQAISWALAVKTGAPSGKAVLLVLANYADARGRCWPSQGRVAAESEQSVDSVQRRLKELEARGLIRREKRSTESGGRSSDLYVLSMPQAEEGHAANCGAPHRTCAVPPTAQVRHEPSTEPSGELSRAVAAATRPDVDALFDRFRSVYPKRDGANPRKPAYEKFAKLLRNGVDPEAIIGGAERYAAECRRKQIIGTDKVAQAITWLNQNRWEDYPAAGGGGAAEQAVKVENSARNGERFYAMRDTPQYEAWDTHLKATRGQGANTDLRGGWWFAAEWPPQ